MNISQNQRKVYYLALALILVAIALFSTWSLWLKPADSTSLAAPTPTAAAQVTPATGATVAPAATPTVGATTEATAAPAQAAKKTSTIVYYQDNYGYLVPVMC